MAEKKSGMTDPFRMGVSNHRKCKTWVGSAQKLKEKELGNGKRYS